MFLKYLLSFIITNILYHFIYGVTKFAKTLFQTIDKLLKTYIYFL